VVYYLGPCTSHPGVVRLKEPKKSVEMQERARRRIPGGTQLLSKRPEMFAPGQWPGYYSRAKGVEVWDLDGNKYVDMSINAAGACVLGYADPDVDSAVHAAIDAGTNSILNSAEEVELADLLCELHPWAQMVRYARSGGESMTIAVRIARAYTKKDKVAFCGYHGWFDWYLAANLARGNNLDGHLLPGLDPAGVPRVLAGTAFPFRYNHVEELEAILKENKNEVGVLVMEPIRDSYPENDFLIRVREVADEIGAVLIFDEVTSAFRMNSGGIHLKLGVTPDVAVFSKALGNGYPIGAVVGKENVMQAAQSTFISSTNWTEKVGPVAALAMIRKHSRTKAGEHLIALGNRIQEGWKKAGDEAGLKLAVSGIPPLSHFAFEHEKSQAMITLFTQLMLKKGYLASGKFYSMYAHKISDVDAYIEATKDVFRSIADALKKGEVEKQLMGPVAHTGFHRLA
jgi:glutamate-1-semialdehyde 2,1-aminomutase